MERISLFGAGFIGGNYSKMFPEEVYIEPRESVNPKFNKILYLRGSTTNYNIFEDPSKDVRDNLLLFTETLKNLTPNNEFILISSWFCEHPKGFYSITKLTQEMLLESYCKTFDIKYKIIRLCNVLGNDPKKSNKKNALEYLIDKLKNNENIEIYEGDNYRNYLDVNTVCRGIKFIIDNGQNGQLYNLGNTKSHKMIDLIDYCHKKLNSKSKILIIPTPKFHSQVQIKDYFMETTELQKLGFINDIDIYKILDSIIK